MKNRRPDSEEEYEQRPPRSDLGGLDLLALVNCANSTRKGITDKGNPVRLQALAARGLVMQALDGGFRVTSEGLLWLQRNMYWVKKL